jgi:hypothetical protein
MTEISVTSYQNHSHVGFTTEKAPVRIKFQPPCQLVYEYPFFEQKSSGLKFSKSQTGSHVTYSCQRAFFAFLCLPFITNNHAAYILTKDTNSFHQFEVKS